MKMYRKLNNPAANRVFKFNNDFPTEVIKIIPLDSYLAEHNIAAQSVKYIWIDTEGFETQVILGAKNLLIENPAPIFVEFNLGAWRQSDCFDEFMTLLESLYSHFIFFDKGKEILHPIEDIRTLTPSNTADFGRIGDGDIFLIKKGLIN